MKYIPQIDFLRAIAVCFVFLFHLEVFKYGYIGVDIFFVISGYLITKVIVSGINKNKFNLIDFYLGRLKRLLPLMLIVVFVTYLIFYYLKNYTFIFNIYKSFIPSLFFYSNYYFSSSLDYFNNNLNQPFLHFWSLAVEEQFYLLWPILLLFQRHYKIIWIIFILSLLFNLSNFVDFSSQYFNFFSRSYQFILGSSILFIEKNLHHLLILP